MGGTPHFRKCLENDPRTIFSGEKPSLFLLFSPGYLPWILATHNPEIKKITATFNRSNVDLRFPRIFRFFFFSLIARDINPSIDSYSTSPTFSSATRIFGRPREREIYIYIPFSSKQLCPHFGLVRRLSPSTFAPHRSRVLAWTLLDVISVSRTIYWKFHVDLRSRIDDREKVLVPLSNRTRAIFLAAHELSQRTLPVVSYLRTN